MFIQILMNAAKCLMPAHNSVPTASAHTYANVLKATSRRLTIEPARNEIVSFTFGFRLYLCVHSERPELSQYFTSDLEPICSTSFLLRDLLPPTGLFFFMEQD